MQHMLQHWSLRIEEVTCKLFSLHAVPFSMGTHSRLGSGSAIMQLAGEPGLVRMVLETCREWEDEDEEEEDEDEEEEDKDEDEEDEEEEGIRRAPWRAHNTASGKKKDKCSVQ